MSQFKSWEIGNCSSDGCCHHTGCDYQCNECICFTFYDPNTGKDTGDTSFGTNIFYLTEALSQSYSEGSGVCINGICSANIPYQVSTSGYQAGDISCKPSGGSALDYATSTYPFIEPLCSGDDQKYNYRQCYGDPSGSNAKMALIITTYPDRETFGTNTINQYNTSDNCFTYVELCTLDACNSGTPGCIPVPYCPTYLKETWDANIVKLLGLDYHGGGITFTANDCPTTTICPYGLCEIKCDEDAGVCEYWITANFSVDWNDNTNKYGVRANDGTWYDNKPVTATWGDTDYNYQLVPVGTYQQYLVYEQCNSQTISMCENNEINHQFHRDGPYAYTECQFCTQVCNDCQNLYLPAKFPTTDLQLSISFSQHFYFRNDFGTVVDGGSATLAANVNFQLDEAPSPNCVFTANQDDATYFPACASTTTTIPVRVNTATVNGGAGYYAGIGQVQLTAVYIGVSGSTRDPVALQNIPAITTLPGTNTRGARIDSVVWSACDCSTWPDGYCDRVACFDSSLNFTGWDTIDGCCSCDCNTDGCTYYYANNPGFSLGATYAYGEIDLCNNVILLTIYDNNLNQIGTITI